MQPNVNLPNRTPTIAEQYCAVEWEFLKALHLKYASPTSISLHSSSTKERELLGNPETYSLQFILPLNEVQGSCRCVHT